MIQSVIVCHFYHYMIIDSLCCPPFSRGSCGFEILNLCVLLYAEKKNRYSNWKKKNPTEREMAMLTACMTILIKWGCHIPLKQR